jgi:hypothetical protein
MQLVELSLVVKFRSTKKISLDAQMSQAKTARVPILQTKAIVAFTLALVFFLVAISLSLPMPVSGTQLRVDLGAADSFAVLAGSGITNTGVTTATGTAVDFGSAPTVAFTGEDQVYTTGIKYTSLDPAVTAAQESRVLAYEEAASNPVTTIDTELGGATLLPGVYSATSGELQITGTLTLDAHNNPNAMWIFQAGSTLVTAASSEVKIINDGDPSNVTWLVGSSATLGVASVFTGSILAQASITANTGAAIYGSLLAGAAVTLDSNTFVNDSYATQEPTEEPTQEPSVEPTEEPTQEPSAEPTEEPTQEPSVEPTEEPTQEPSAEPTPVETELPPTPERTTDSGGQLPNTSAFNWAALLASGFGFISLGTGIHWTRRRSG